MPNFYCLQRLIETKGYLTAAKLEKSFAISF